MSLIHNWGYLFDHAVPQIQICQRPDILCNHVFLTIIAGNISKYPEFFHPANAVLNSNAKLCMPCVVSFVFGRKWSLL